MSVRVRLIAVIVVTCIAGAIALPAFAGSSHPVCVAKQHDCGKTLSIKPCCCGEQQNPADQTGPAASKVSLTITFVLVTAAGVDSPGSADSALALVRSASSPPRPAAVDIPTLFATLLI